MTLLEFLELTLMEAEDLHEVGETEAAIRLLQEALAIDDAIATMREDAANN